MSATIRLAGIAMAIGGMALVYAPRANASTDSTEETAGCDVTTNGNHCCLCSPRCMMTSDSGVASCGPTSCSTTLCLVG